MRNLFAGIACCMIALGATAPANATVLQFNATLAPDLGQISSGSGSATVWWDKAAQTMHIRIGFTGLSAGTTASHIHCCVSAPATASVATTVPTFPNFPLGVTSGVYDMTFDMTDAASYNPAFIAANGGTAGPAEAALLAGLESHMAYLNIHTTNYPGGEIRGFFSELITDDFPEPATPSLLGMGLLGAFAAARRKRT